MAVSIFTRGMKLKTFFGALTLRIYFLLTCQYQSLLSAQRPLDCTVRLDLGQSDSFEYCNLYTSQFWQTIFLDEWTIT